MVKRLLSRSTTEMVQGKVTHGTEMLELAVVFDGCSLAAQAGLFNLTQALNAQALRLRLHPRGACERR